MTLLDIRPPIQNALRRGRPVVALESTLISHGLPWPTNLETARCAKATNGRTLLANVSLIVANAALAGHVAVAFQQTHDLRPV